MKVDEVYKSGVTDNEDLGEHSRMQADLTFSINFAHEKGLEEVIGRIMNHPILARQLEITAGKAIRQVIAKAMHTNQIPPGDGWTDDYEVACTVSTKATGTY